MSIHAVNRLPAYDITDSMIYSIVLSNVKINLNYANCFARLFIRNQKSVTN